MDFGVKEFDAIVLAFYEGKSHAERQKAQSMLTEFQNNPNSWQLVDRIFEQSSSLQAKFIALGVLEEFIKVRWNTLPMDQRLTVRNYVVKAIIDLSSDESTLRSAVLNKLDLVLVQIVKKDWPQYWPSFIQEIVDSSGSNPSLCENNMKILGYLSEEVFDFSRDHMTVAKMRKLKDQMVNEFGSVFALCKRILSTADDGSTNLVKATLDTLQKFISWIPVQFVYQQDLIALLEAKMNGPQKDLVLQCFAEIVGLDNVDSQQYSDIILTIYTTVHSHVSAMLPLQCDIAKVYAESSSSDQRFIEVLAIFLSTLLSKYRTLIESTENGVPAVNDMLLYMLGLSRVPEREVWRICLEYWGKLANDVLQELSHGQQTPYLGILNELVLIMIDNMVKPDDVLVVEDDEGEVSREFVKQSDTTALSKSMRHVFHLLASIDPAYTHNIIRREQLALFERASWSWDRLFRLCWSIGMMAGAVPEQQENQFLETILAGDLFTLLQREEEKKEGDQQWVIASCMLYIAGQYPHFLKSHWDFASWLLQRIFSYMQSEGEGIREMACDAFLKICQGCKEELAMPHRLTSGGQQASVLQTVLSDLSGLIVKLSQHQICALYESIGIIISALSSDVDLQKQSLQMLMMMPNQTTEQTLQKYDTPNSLKTMVNMLKINVVTCKPVGPVFRMQLHQIAPYLIQAYSLSSQYIQSAGQQEHQLHLRVRHLVLELLETFVLSTERFEIQDQNMLTDLIQTILLDYKKSSQSPEKRESSVLSLLTALFEKMQEPIWPDLLKETIDIEYIVTLPMITANFVDYPECRYEFYRLLKSINKRCFIDLFQTPELFRLNIDSIMWGTKHTIKDVSQMALQTCLAVVQEAASMDDEDVSSQFFETYYVRILTDILEILVDPDCRNGFNYQSQILARMLELVQEGEIYTRLFNPDQVSDPLMSNVEFLQQYVLNLLCTAFPLLNKDQIEVLVMGMFEYSGDLQKFQNDIRDFLIDIREVNDTSETQQKAREELDAELELLRGL